MHHRNSRILSEIEGVIPRNDNERMDSSIHDKYLYERTTIKRLPSEIKKLYTSISSSCKGKRAVQSALTF